MPNPVGGNPARRKRTGNMMEERKCPRCGSGETSFDQITRTGYCFGCGFEWQEK